MITVPVHAAPPRWMETAVSSLLPPACREAVLGDLHERFGERRARARWIGYLGDVATTVPHVVWSQMRRISTRGSAFAAAGDLRSRAERLQTRIWFRNVVLFMSAVFLIAVLRLNTRTGWQFNDVVSLAMTIGWIGATWHSYRAHGSTLVPASLSRDELRAFQRRELRRQMDLKWRTFVYWSLPAIVLIVYGLAGGVPGFRGKALSLLAGTAMQVCAVAWSHRLERRQYQRELDQMDQEAEPA